MLHELDTALRALVEREIGEDADVEIDFDAPTKDWASHRNRPTIDIFQFAHHKSRQQAKPRILQLLDLTFLAHGTNVVIIGNPGVGKTPARENRRLARLPSQSPRSVHHCHGHAQPSARFAG